MYHFENASAAAIVTVKPAFRTLIGACSSSDTTPLLISLTGAGGKTATLWWLARAFAAEGKRVLVTTTTRMYLPRPDQYRQLSLTGRIDPNHLADLPRQQEPGIHAVFAGLDAAIGKVRGLAPETVDALKHSGRYDVLLVEADGARQRLFKLPEQHEPCIPASSDCVIAVLGSAMLDAPVTPDNMLRWDRFQALTGLKSGERLSWQVLEPLLDHPQGLFKGTPADARRIWFINGPYQNEAAWLPALTALLPRHPSLSAIWQGAISEAIGVRNLLTPA